MTFQFVGQGDVWALSASLRPKIPQLSPSVRGVRKLPLNADAVERWPQLKKVLSHLKPLPASAADTMFFEWLDPGCVVDWWKSEVAEGRLCVVANPGAVEYSNAEPCFIMPGSVVVISPGWRTSANFSPYRRIHLVVALGG